MFEGKYLSSSTKVNLTVKCEHEKLNLLKIICCVITVVVIARVFFYNIDILS